MKLIRDIPDVYCDIIEAGLYKPNPDTLSVTDLANPPLIKHLKIKHWDELEHKASEYLWMILGIAGHKVFETESLLKNLNNILRVAHTSRLENQLSGEALYGQLHQLLLSNPSEKKMEILIKDKPIRGKMDFRQTGIIRDFKFTSVWSFRSGVKPEWEAQLNIYAFMAQKHGLPTDKIIVDAILRDWSIGDSLRNHDYPEIPFVSLGVNKWSIEDQYKYILNRVEAYEKEPVQCSSHTLPNGKIVKEMWQKETIYAVMHSKKEGSKKKPRAINGGKCYSLEDAQKLYNPEKHGGIEIRPGERTRCLYYCPVRKVCPFNKKEDKGNKKC